MTIPDSVTAIGFYAFTLCTNLTSVTYCGTQEQWDAISIYSGNTALTKATRQYHDWQDATCTAPKTCTSCNKTEGEAMGHSCENFCCTVCGYFDKAALVKAVDLNTDNNVTAFDAQILAEANAGLRTLTDVQWANLGNIQVQDIIDYVLGRYSRT